MSDDTEKTSPDVETIKKFMAFFTYRDEMYSKLTGKIFDFFQSNIITTFEELLQLPKDNLKWMDAQLDMEETEGTLLLSFSIKYNREQANSFIIKSFGFDDKEENNIRIIKFGLPLYYVFASKHEVKDFILNITNSDESDLDHSDTTQVSFDTSTLSETQLAQLKLFESKGTKH